MTVPPEVHLSRPTTGPLGDPTSAVLGPASNGTGSGGGIGCGVGGGVGSGRGPGVGPGWGGGIGGGAYRVGGGGRGGSEFSTLLKPGPGFCGTRIRVPVRERKDAMLKGILVLLIATMALLVLFAPPALSAQDQERQKIMVKSREARLKSGAQLNQRVTERPRYFFEFRGLLFAKKG